MPDSQEIEASPRRRSVIAAARALAHGAVDLVWPPTCAACRSAIDQAHGLCPACWRDLALIEQPYCERLGTPFPAGHAGPLLAPEAIADPPAFDRARAVARYDAIARLLVTRLKFSDRSDLALLMGRMMTTAGRDLLAEADALVPIPLHRLRYWQRRYNQAALLAGTIAQLTGVPRQDGWLTRRRRTPPQLGLSRSERQRNMSGAFAVPDARKPEVAGRRIVLIDDVRTTGATIAAAAVALRRAGAARIDVLTFALTTRET